MTSERTKSADQPSFGTTETPGTLHSLPVASGSPPYAIVYVVPDLENVSSYSSNEMRLIIHVDRGSCSNLMLRFYLNKQFGKKADRMPPSPSFSFNGTA